MSFGFSVGDFLVVGGVILKLVDALRGTRSEFQELIYELESLERALGQVEKLNGQADQAATIDRIKCHALTCRYPLENFQTKIEKYHESLGVGKSAGKVKDAGKKIQYAFKTRKEADKLREYLKQHIYIINMSLTEYSVKLLAIASEERKENQEELRSRIEGSSKELREVRDNVEAQALNIRSNGSTLRNLLWTVTSEIAAPLKSLGQMVTNIFITTQQIYTIVLELRDGARDIDTRFTYFQPPVRVEDALARVFPFPAECSVEALSCELKVRFREGACMEEVMAGSFEVFNSENPDQTLTISDRNGLVSGMSIKMVVILAIEVPDREECSKPHCASEEFVEMVGGGRSW